MPTPSKKKQQHQSNPHLSKLLSALLRRLRDPDAAVRLATVAAARSLSSHLTSSPFTSLAKPFVEALFTEQELNAQNGAALCLAAVAEGSECPHVVSLRQMLPTAVVEAKKDEKKKIKDETSPSPSQERRSTRSLACFLNCCSREYKFCAETESKLTEGFKMLGLLLSWVLLVLIFLRLY